MANPWHKISLLETRLGQMEKQLEKAEGMLKRTYAFMKQCERSGMVPEGWTVDSGNGGTTFRPMGSTSAATPDAQLLRQIKTYALPSPQRSPSLSNNNNDNSQHVDEHAEERRELKRLKTEMAQNQQALKDVKAYTCEDK